MVYADLWKRISAFMIDLIILLCINLIFSALIGIIYFSINPDFQDNPLLVIFNVIIIWLYFTAFESSKIQASPGKKIMRLKVVNFNNEKLSFKRSTIRFFCSILSLLTIFIGFFVSCFSEKKQSLHDKLSKTFVVSII